MKRLLVALATVMAVLAVGIAAAVLLVDWDQVRRELLARAGKAAGLAVAFDGDVGFALVPRPLLTIEGVRIGPDGSAGDATILAAEKVAVAPSLLGLLSGQIAISSVRVEGVSLTLERDAKGRGNWEDLIEALTPGEESGTASPIDIRIRRGTVFLLDRVTGQEETIGGISGRLSIPGTLGNYKIDAALQWRGVPVTVVGSAAQPDQGGRAPFDLTVRSQALGAATLSGRALIAGAGAAIEQGRLKIDITDLNELFARPGQPKPLPASLRALSLNGALGATATGATLDDLRIVLGASTATGAVKARFGAVPQVDIALQVGQIALDPFLEGSGGGTGAVTLPRGIGGSLVLEVGAAPLRGSALRSLRLDARLNDGIVTVAELKGIAPGSTALSVSGQVVGTAAGPRLEGRMSAQSDDLRAFLGWLGAETDAIAAARLRRATATGNLVVDDGALTLDELRGEFDSSFVSGRVRVPWDEAADVALDLTVDRLDADAYMRTEPAETPRRAKPAAKGVGRGLDGRVVMERLTVASHMLQDVRAEGRLQGGDLTLRSLTMEIPGAASLRASGKVGEQGGAPSFDGRVELASQEPDALIRWLGMTPSPGLQALRPLSVAAAVTASGKRVVAQEIDGKLGDTHVTGSASLDQTSGRPTITAEVKIDSWLIPWDTSAAAPAPVETGPRPVDFSWVTGFDLDLRASAAEVRALRYTLQDVRAVARIREHVIELERVTGRAYGGWIRARGRVEAAEERAVFTAIVEAGDVDLAPLLSDAAGVDELSGKLHLAVEVKGAGATDIELIRSSDGTGRVVATDGALRGFNMGRIARKIAAIENIGDLGDLISATEAGGETPFSLMQGTVVITSGVVRTEDMELRMEGGTGKANGWVDVAGLNVSLRGEVTIDEAPGKPSIGIVVRGALDEPERELKTGELRRYVQKRINDAALGKATPPMAETAIDEAVPHTIELPKPPRRFRK